MLMLKSSYPCEPRLLLLGAGDAGSAFTGLDGPGDDVTDTFFVGDERENFVDTWVTFSIFLTGVAFFENWNKIEKW